MRTTDLTEKEKTDIQDGVIQKIGRDWLPSPYWRTSLEAFSMYVRSDYTLLPHGRGWLNEPQWIQYDFRLYLDLLDFYIINELWKA